MVSRRDLKKSREFPMASQDPNKQLLVAASCPCNLKDDASIMERVHKLVEAGADCLVIDAAQGDSTQQVDFLGKVKSYYPNLDVVCGNVVTPRQAQPLLDAGADGIRVGMGCSSLFSGQEAVAVGRPQASAVYHVARFCREYANKPVIADGGVQNGSHISMALILGASTVMCGSLLAGTEESPGESFFHNGLKLKNYRGSGNLELMPSTLPNGTSAGTQLEQGVSCAVVDRGSVKTLLPYLLENVKKELRRLGASSLPNVYQDLYSSAVRFHVRSPGNYGSAGFGTVL